MKRLLQKNGITVHVHNKNTNLFPSSFYVVVGVLCLWQRQIQGSSCAPPLQIKEACLRCLRALLTHTVRVRETRTETTGPADLGSGLY